MSSSITSCVLSKYCRLFVSKVSDERIPSILRLTVMIQVYAGVMGLTLRWLMSYVYGAPILDLEHQELVLHIYIYMRQ